jgi:hypothetical protein
MRGDWLIHYDGVPASLNAGGVGSRQHWSKGAKEKKRWEEIFWALLMEQSIPKQMQRCEIEAWITFKTSHRRDPENYRASISKPFADTLVKGGWLPDDTQDYFDFKKLWIAYGLKISNVKARLSISIKAFYPSAEDKSQRGPKQIDKTRAYGHEQNYSPKKETAVQ